MAEDKLIGSVLESESCAGPEDSDGETIDSESTDAHEDPVLNEEDDLLIDREPNVPSTYYNMKTDTA